MVDREVLMFFAGAVVALVSSVVAALVQHFLSLRADRISRERDRRDEGRREMLRNARAMGKSPEDVIRFAEWLKEQKTSDVIRLIEWIDQQGKEEGEEVKSHVVSLIEWIEQQGKEEKEGEEG